MKRYRSITGFLALCFISAYTTGCWSDPGSIRFKPGTMESFQTREVASFNKVELNGNFIVYLQNSSVCSLSVEGDEDILNMVLTEVENSTLRIGYMNERYNNMDQPVIVNIGVNDLQELSGQKAVKVITTDVFLFNHLKMDFAGAVNLEMELHGQSVTGVFAGASSIDLKGKVDSLNFDIPGAGKMRAFELEARKVELNLAGAGKADIFVTEQLRVNMAGACHVSYKGTPSSVYSNISGIGRLKKID